ncbi:MAG: hypothetical protein ACOYY2_03010 [Actinomycetota bacterium]
MNPSRLIPLALGALLLAGCTSGSAGDAEPTGTNAPAATTAAAESEPEPPAETTPAAPAYAAFGQTYTWDDGLAVTVSPPAPFTPSETAAFTESPAYLAFEVKVVNGTAEPYEPAVLYLTLQSGNTEASQVFDVGEAGLAGPPATPLLPGREAVFKVGFGVADPADLVMQVAPGFEYDPAIFTTG